MSRALWLLLGLQMRGWLRYLGRGVGTVRGMLLLLVGLGVFIPWLGAVLAGPGAGRVDPDSLARYGPAPLLLYCVLSVVLTPGKQAVYFTPAEVQFLFAGPFSRREVLIYKILLTLSVSLPATMLMGAIVRVRNAWLPAVLAGLFLLSAFVQLFTMAVHLVANAVGANLYTRGRQIGAILLAVLVGALLLEAGRRANWQWRLVGEQIIETRAWQVASWPLRSFFDVLGAERFSPALLGSLLVGLGVNAVLVGVILALEHSYQEASAASSARRYAALQRMRGRSVGAEPPDGGRGSRFALPDLPFLGGIGPVLWRQMTTAFRGLKRLVIVFTFIASVLVLVLRGTVAEVGETMLLLLSLGVWLSIFLTALVPYDFRGDLDRIGLLKTLPVAPWRLVVGQLLTPVLLLALVQWLCLAILLALVPDHGPELAACAIFVPVFNFLLIALDNLLFLLFPVRVMAATPGDFQALGRNVLLSLGKLVGLGLVAGIAFVASVIVYLLLYFLWPGLPEHTYLWLAIASAWPVLLICDVALVPVIALAFRWFDVSRDTPA
jgi:hypothetical protein